VDRGKCRGSADVGTVVGAVILLAIAGVLLYRGWRFALVVLDGRSPGVGAWVLTGVLLFLVGAVAGVGIAKVLRAGEDRAGHVGAIVGALVLAAGLGTSYYWAVVRELPLVTALGPACRGHDVPAAPVPAGVRRVVALDDRGHEIDWTTRDAAWRADQVADADLVACVGRTEETLETCSYRPVTGGPARTIDRLEEVLTVRIVEARTAAAVGQFELRGAPRACKDTEKESQGDLHGQVSLAAFSTALAPYLTQ
jgi:hypothetical protein